MITTPGMGLTAWNSPTDIYSSDQLAVNWTKVDQHNHTPGKGIRIPTDGIANGAITSDKFAPDAFESLDIPDGSVSTAKIVNLAVTTAKLNDNSVTTGKINNLAVTGAKIANNTITETQLGSGSVGTAELQDNSVTSAEIAVGAVNTSELAGGSVTSPKVSSNAITTGSLVDDAVTTVKIDDLAVTGAKVAGSTIGAGKLALTNTETVLSTDLDVSSEISFVDVLSVTPAAGTYLAIAVVQGQNTTGTPFTITARFVVNNGPLPSADGYLQNNGFGSVTIAHFAAANGTDPIIVQAFGGTLPNDVKAVSDSTRLLLLRFG
jgi:hypothetical protein